MKNVQAGIRQDVAGPDTTYAVLGIQGLSPYMFELDGALFLSHRQLTRSRVVGFAPPCLFFFHYYLPLRPFGMSASCKVQPPVLSSKI